MLCNRGQGLLTVAGLQCRVAIRLQPRHDDVAVGLVIVDYENARGVVHGNACSRRYGTYSLILASSARGLYGLVTYASQPAARAFASSPLKA